jgi:predicted nucleic acid-binding protein
VIVADTSAIVDALIGRPGQPDLLRRLQQASELHAPHLLDVEILHVLRRLLRTGALSPDRAADARHDFQDLAIVRYPHQPLSDRMWQLRDNVSAYDAAFLALAETLGVPLITCDARLAHASGHHAQVELFGRA